MGISKNIAQKKISLLWFISSGILFLIFVLYTAFNRFDGKEVDGWQWYSQNIIPSLTLMVSTYFSTKNETNDNGIEIDNFAYRLAFSISLVYFLILYLTILLAPVAFKVANLSIIDFLKKSQIYLIILQGIVTASLGLFFTKVKTQ